MEKQDGSGERAKVRNCGESYPPQDDVKRKIAGQFEKVDENDEMGLPLLLDCGRVVWPEADQAMARNLCRSVMVCI